MNTEKSMRVWIEQSNYKQLLTQWRWGDLGSDFFRGEVGAYFRETMFKKKQIIGDEAAIRISKEVGF